MQVDRVLLRGNVLTLGPRVSRAEAFAISGGRIVAVGSTAAIERLVGARTKVIDAAGRIVVPGFVESHAHLIATGVHQQSVNVFGLRTLREQLAAVRRRAAVTLHGRWVSVVGFDDTLVEDRRYPTCRELDEVAPLHPVFLSRIDGHSSVLNTLAFRVLRISRSMGGVERDAAGRPTGVLRAPANDVAESRFGGQFSRTERARFFRLACEAALRAGITTAHTIEAAGQDTEIVVAARKRTPLRVRVYTVVKTAADIRQSPDGVKLFADGSIDSQTALLSSPYADRRDTSGIFYQKPPTLRKLVALARKQGKQVVVHAIGDRAISEVLSVWERLGPGDRPRIEHFELPDRSAYARCRRLGVIVSVQPAFVHFWDYERFFVHRLGARRAQRIHPYRSLLRARVRLAGGSDSPVTPLNPLLGIHAAVNHPLEGQRLTRLEALRLFTIDGAYAGFEESSRGTLEVGKLADFVFLSGDPLETAPSKLKELQVLKTFVGGRCAYDGPRRAKAQVAQDA